MKSDKRTAEEIDRDIAEKRAAVAANVSKLKASITLGSIAQHVGKVGLRATGSLSLSAVKQAWKNPLPVAMIVSGVAWLVAANAKSSSSTSKPASDASNSDETVVRPDPSPKAAAAGDQSTEDGESALRGIVEQHPFFVGALALAAGAALASVIPRSKAEDDLVASTEDLLRAEKEKLADMARKIKDEAAAIITKVSDYPVNATHEEPGQSG